MSREDGEFELVLGNRQLLSVFFIVVVLLGVFFMMGYILGRSSGAARQEVSSTPATIEPISAAGAKSSPSGEAMPPPTASGEVAPPAGSAAVVEKPQPVTKAQEEVPVALPKVEAPKVEAKKTEPKVEEKPKPVPAPAPAGGKVPRGAYLQVAATSLGDAQSMSAKLRGAGFPVQIQLKEDPNPSQLHRVLVGPFDKGALNASKGKLKDAGYASIPKNVN
jgi:cell division septation protein DedD